MHDTSFLLQAVQTNLPCYAAQMALAVKLDEQLDRADFVISLLQRPLTYGALRVINPDPQQVGVGPILGSIAYIHIHSVGMPVHTSTGCISLESSPTFPRASSQVALSSGLRVLVTNPAVDGSGSGNNSSTNGTSGSGGSGITSFAFVVDEMQIKTAVATPLGYRNEQVRGRTQELRREGAGNKERVIYASGLVAQSKAKLTHLLLNIPSALQIAFLSPTFVARDIPPPPPPTIKKHCPKPHLGELCGDDASAAIAGIAIGGAVLLGLIIAAIVFGFKSRVSGFPRSLQSLALSCLWGVSMGRELPPHAALHNHELAKYKFHLLNSLADHPCRHHG